MTNFQENRDQLDNIMHYFLKTDCMLLNRLSIICKVQNIKSKPSVF